MAQVSLTALNPLLSFETHVAAQTASFLTQDYDGDTKICFCLYLPRCLLSFGKVKKKTRKNQHIKKRNRDENKSSE